MLVLTRRTGESILIDGGIEVKVLGVKGNQVRIGIAAPRHINAVRGEIAGHPPKNDTSESTA